MTVPSGSPTPETSLSGDQLRERLLVGVDWGRVIDSYLLANEDPETRQAAEGSPIYELPAVIQDLGSNAEDQAAAAGRMENFYSFLGSQDLLADVAAHDANLRAQEGAASTGPAPSLAEHEKTRSAQNTRLITYVGAYRLGVPPYSARLGNGLQQLQELARLIDPRDPRLAPIDAQLHDRADKLMDQLNDEMIHAPEMPEHVSARVDGDPQLLVDAGVDPVEFGRMIQFAAHSYPRALMAREVIARINAVGPYSRSTAVTSTGPGMAVIDLWLNKEKLENAKHFVDRREFRNPDEESVAALEGLLDHEFAHIAQQNAPVEWLRRWDALVQKGIPLEELSRYAKQSSDGDRVHAGNEHVAEAIQIYRSDPVHVLNTIGIEPFMLLQELLHSYNDETIVRELNGLQLPLNEEAEHRLRRVLIEDRQTKLASDLHDAGIISH